MLYPFEVEVFLISCLHFICALLPFHDTLSERAHFCWYHALVSKRSNFLLNILKCIMKYQLSKKNWNWVLQILWNFGLIFCLVYPLLMEFIQTLLPGPCLHSKGNNSWARSCEGRVYPSNLWCTQGPENLASKDCGILHQGFRIMCCGCSWNDPKNFAWYCKEVSWAMSARKIS